MATVVPKEGVYSLFNYLNPVKGAGKREAMLAYIEQALSDEAIGPLVDFFRYGPCTDIKLSEAVSKDVVLSGAPRVLFEARDDILNNVIDDLEDNLTCRALAGEPWAVRFFLRTRARHRGYGAS